MRRAGVPSLAALAILAAAAASPTPSADALRAEIDARSAKAVVARLNAAHPGSDGLSDWDRVTDEMARGRPAYIALAPKLARGADAGPAEDLGIALAFALPRAPLAVLGVVDLQDVPPLGVGRVCGVPFIEDMMADVPGYIRRAKVAVSRVQSPDLELAKAACLAALSR